MYNVIKPTILRAQPLVRLGLLRFSSSLAAIYGLRTLPELCSRPHHVSFVNSKVCSPSSPLSP